MDIRARRGFARDCDNVRIRPAKSRQPLRWVAKQATTLELDRFGVNQG